MPYGMLRSAASPEARGVRPVRGWCEWPPQRHRPRPATLFSGFYRLLRPDDGPALFAQFHQGDDAGRHVIGIRHDRDLLVLALAHRVDGVLARLEAHIGHALGEP